MLPKGDDPFQVKEHINDNVYMLDLSSGYNVSATFNVLDLSLLDRSNDLKVNSSEQKGNDEDQRTISEDLLHMPVRPIICIRVKLNQKGG